MYFFFFFCSISDFHPVPEHFLIFILKCFKKESQCNDKSFNNSNISLKKKKPPGLIKIINSFFFSDVFSIFPFNLDTSFVHMYVNINGSHFELVAQNEKNRKKLCKLSQFITKRKNLNESKKLIMFSQNKKKIKYDIIEKSINSSKQTLCTQLEIGGFFFLPEFLWKEIFFFFFKKDIQFISTEKKNLFRHVSSIFFKTFNYAVQYMIKSKTFHFLPIIFGHDFKKQISYKKFILQISKVFCYFFSSHISSIIYRNIKVAYVVRL